MAQRTIHMLFVTLLLDKMELSDKNRFFIGSILPDAYTNPINRKVSHFIKYIPEENCLYFNFQDYFEKNGNSKLNVLDYKWENKRG